jgi:LuxR family maltose regulon positive regulatory protein
LATPVIATKLYAPPHRPGLVARRRVLDLLKRAPEARLTLVSAPAGFGKTTLLAEWLEDSAGPDRAVAWLSLDPADAAPASFWTYVVTALQRAVPGVGSEAIELVASTPVPAEFLLTGVVNELAGSTHPVWLVLDDYHLVDGREIGEGMAFLLDHLPAQVHVVISTRADPGLPLAKWRARDDLVEVRAADLRFTGDEVDAFLEASGLQLGSRDVAVLAERTEGWITALQLAALSLRGRKDASDFIARFAGDDRYVVDYLIEEVLGHQTPSVRQFLLQTSVLGRLAGPLCDALTDRDDGAEMLAALERANLFLVALDDHREWYRYHHLFADVLSARLLSEQPDAIRQLHQRASRWYERHQLIEESVRHAMAASDHDRTVRLIELAVPEIRRHRQDALALGWLRALPDDAVRRSPVLSVYAGYMRMVSGDPEGAETRFSDAERALGAAAAGEARTWADTEESRTLPATIAVYRASLAQARGDVAGTVQHARRALELAGPDDHQSRGGGAGFLGLAAWAEGDVATGIETFSVAVASLRAGGNLVDELAGTVVLADMWSAAGRPDRARSLLTKALQTGEEHGAPAARAVADLHVGLGEIDLESGYLESAKRHLALAAGPDGPRGMAESHYRWYLAQALTARIGGDRAEADRMLDRAEEAYHPGFFPDVRPIGAIRARMRIAQGDLREAADWAGERGVSPTDDATFLHEFDHLTLVRLLIAQQRAEQQGDPAGHALALLGRLLPAAEASGRHRSLFEIRLLQALAHDARGQRVDALEVLAEAFAPEPESAVRLVLDEGAAMQALLHDAARAAGGEYARRVLRLQPPGGPAAGSAAGQGTGGLSGRELQVLKLLDSDLSGPEIARRLFVSQNTLRSHTKHIFTKLDVTSRRSAVLRARERGLI